MRPHKQSVANLDPSFALVNASKLVTKSTEHERLRAAMLVNRVRKNMRRLKGWRTRHQVSCYRLYDADIPELPFELIDTRGGYTLQMYGVNQPMMTTLAWLTPVSKLLADAFDLPSEAIAIKRRIRQKGRQQYTRLSRSEERFAVGEGELNFWSI